MGLKLFRKLLRGVHFSQFNSRWLPLPADPSKQKNSCHASKNIGPYWTFSLISDQCESLQTYDHLLWINKDSFGGGTHIYSSVAASVDCNGFSSELWIFVHVHQSCPPLKTKRLNRVFLSLLFTPLNVTGRDLFVSPPSRVHLVPLPCCSPGARLSWAEMSAHRCSSVCCLRDGCQSLFSLSSFGDIPSVVSDFFFFLLKFYSSLAKHVFSEVLHRQGTSQQLLSYSCCTWSDLNIFDFVTHAHCFCYCLYLLQGQVSHKEQ